MNLSMSKSIGVTGRMIGNTNVLERKLSFNIKGIKNLSHFTPVIEKKYRDN